MNGTRLLSSDVPTCRHIYLLRHGQYDLDSKDHGLTELGKEQAKLTGIRLRKMMLGERKDRYKGPHYIDTSSIACGILEEPTFIKPVGKANKKQLR